VQVVVVVMTDPAETNLTTTPKARHLQLVYEAMEAFVHAPRKAPIPMRQYRRAFRTVSGDARTGVGGGWRIVVCLRNASIKVISCTVLYH